MSSNSNRDGATAFSPLTFAVLAGFVVLGTLGVALSFTRDSAAPEEQVSAEEAEASPDTTVPAGNVAGTTGDGQQPAQEAPATEPAVTDVTPQPTP